MRFSKPLFVATLILLAGCALSGEAAEPATPQLDWLTGCWHSEDGNTREVWSQSEDGYLFGYSVVRNQGNVVFFEQMRVDPGAMPSFQAYPSGAGPSGFPAVSITPRSVTFANPDHDYPQKITYARDGNTLSAVISLIDDTRQGHFNFTACATEGS